MPLIAQPCQQCLQADAQILSWHNSLCSRGSYLLTTLDALAGMTVVFHDFYWSVHQSGYLLSLHSNWSL
jgi:hypothetical protein